MQVLNEDVNSQKQIVKMQIELSEDEQRIATEVGLRKILLDTIKSADNYESNPYLVVPTRFEIRKRHSGEVSFSEFTEEVNAVIQVDAQGIKTMLWDKVDEELISTINTKIKELQELFEALNIRFGE